MTHCADICGTKDTRQNGHDGASPIPGPAVYKERIASSFDLFSNNQINIFSKFKPHTT